MRPTRIISQGAVVIALLLAAIGGTWHYARQDLRTCMVDDNLQPIASLLEENRKIIDGLQAGGFANSESTILESYLANIRKDGAPKYSAMKQRIDTLVNNNTVIVALLSKYSVHAKTPAFKAATEQYRNYAISFRDRWQSVFEIFMTGGNLPADGPSIPPMFSSALANEESSIPGR
jgi:hypothetical protein